MTSEPDANVFEVQLEDSPLPQVWEQLPSVSEFMAHLKNKAGLPAQFWATELKLQRYTVSKYKESDLLPDALASDQAGKS